MVTTVYHAGGLTNFDAVKQKKEGGAGLPQTNASYFGEVVLVDKNTSKIRVQAGEFVVNVDEKQVAKDN